ncbi:MAG: conjugal transfer protein TraD [Lacticaseibacillus paracasei]
MNEEWIIERIEHIRNKKSPSDQQRLLVLLAEKDDKTPKEEQDLKALVRAEKAVARLEKAAEKVASSKTKVSKILKAERSAKEKARTHELIKSAGLLIKAGLVDSATGKPLWDREELLEDLSKISKNKFDKSTV